MADAYILHRNSGSSISDDSDKAIIQITTDVGNTINCVSADGTIEYTKKCGTRGYVNFPVDLGTWSLVVINHTGTNRLIQIMTIDTKKIYEITIKPVRDAQINVNTNIGNTVQFIKGSTVETRVVNNTGLATYYTPDFGDWTIVVTHSDGRNSLTQTVTTEAAGVYDITSMPIPGCIIRVMTDNLNYVALTDGTNTYSGTCGTQGFIDFLVAIGNWDIEVLNKKGENPMTATVSVVNSVTKIITMKPQQGGSIRIISDHLNIVKITKDDTSKSQICTEGYVVFDDLDFGIWSILVTRHDGTNSTSDEVNITDYTTYSAEIRP